MKFFSKLKKGGGSDNIPEQVPWKGLWKETAKRDDKSNNNTLVVQVPIQFALPRHTEQFMKQVLQIQVNKDEVLQLSTGATMVLTVKNTSSGASTRLGICTKCSDTSNYEFHRPQPFPERNNQKVVVSKKHQGIPYYYYGIMYPNGKIIVPGSPNMALAKGPAGSKETYLLSADTNETIAKWKNVLKPKERVDENVVSVYQGGLDFGLLMLLVVLADLQQAELQFKANAAVIGKATVASVAIVSAGAMVGAHGNQMLG